MTETHIDYEKLVKSLAIDLWYMQNPNAWFDEDNIKTVRCTRYGHDYEIDQYTLEVESVQDSSSTLVHLVPDAAFARRARVQAVSDVLNLSFSDDVLNEDDCTVLAEKLLALLESK